MRVIREWGVRYLASNGETIENPQPSLEQAKWLQRQLPSTRGAELIVRTVTEGDWEEPAQEEVEAA